MPSFHVFAEMDLLAGKQTEADSFGAKSADEFRLTSSFTITSDVKAFAVVKGTVLLQLVDTDSSLVNLILKPMNQSKVNFPPVKYFIYRGLKKSDFISGTSVVATGSEFINEINAIQRKRNQTLEANGQPAENIPLEALLGHDLNPAPQKKLDDFFFNQSQTVQLHMAQIGMHLGNFKSGAKIGFEIVLENPGHFPEVAMAKKLENSITGASGNTIDKRHLRETVLNFVDPAAYYGMHLDDKERVGYRDSTNANNGDKKERDVYELIVKNFFTRNRVYLDIRNENGYSLNYYQNYQSPDAPTDKEIRIGDSATSLQKAEYYNRFSWPFHSIDNPAISQNGESVIFITLPVNDNPKPLLYFEHGESSKLKKTKFIAENDLIGGDMGWTKPVDLKFVNIPTASTTEKVCATVIRLIYIKQIAVSVNALSSVVPTKTYLDNIFGPLNQSPLWVTNKSLTWASASHRKYLDASVALHLLYRNSATIQASVVDPRKFVVSGNITGSVFFNDRITIENSPGNDGVYTVLSASFVSGNTEIITVEAIPTSSGGGNVIFFKTQQISRVDKSLKKIYVLNTNLTNDIQVGAEVIIEDISASQRKYNVASITFIDNSTEVIVTQSLKDHGFGCMMSPGVSIGPDKIIFYASPFDYHIQDQPQRSSLVKNLIGGSGDKDTILSVIEDFDKYSTKQLDVLVIPSFANEMPLFSLKEMINSTQSKTVSSNFFALAITNGVNSEFDRLKTASESLSNFHHKLLFLEETGNIPFERDTNAEKYKQYEVKVGGYDAGGNFALISPTPAVTVFTLNSNRRIFSSFDFSQIG